MKPIDVFRMARIGASLHGDVELARLPRLAASLMRCDGRLAFEAQGRIDPHGRPAMALSLQALLPLRCDRCARELEFALSVQRPFYFVHSEAELAAIEVDDAPDEPLLGSAHFDLAGLIEDEAILQLPLSPRHDACAPAQAVGVAPEEAPRPHPFSQLQGLRERLRGPAADDAAGKAQGNEAPPARPRTGRTSG
jgi:uncharacterized protein